jgi:quinol monooxygenase YgiN
MALDFPMSNSTIRVVARVIALPDRVEALKAVLLQIIEPTRQENGCIKYELLQNQDDPSDFTFVEEWTDRESLKAHLASVHLQDAIVKLEGLVAANPDIRIYNTVR